MASDLAVQLQVIFCDVFGCMGGMDRNMHDIGRL